MYKNPYFKIALFCIFWLGILHGLTASADDCLNDLKTRVQGKEDCLAIHTFIDHPEIKPTTLLVFIHGDQSDRGPVTGMIRLAKNIEVPAGIVKVALLRPDYFDNEGNESSGTNYGRKDSYTSGNISEVTAAIQALQRYYGATETVIVGHSGGAAYAGVMIGRTPGIANAALLLSCPCDIRSWRANNHNSYWSSLSPSDFYENVPLSTRVVAITGEFDDNTSEYLAKDYIASLVSRGIYAKFYRAPHASHNDTIDTQVVLEPLRTLLNPNVNIGQ